MHIIYNINVVYVGWITEDVVDLHCTCQLTFSENRLPATRYKSTVFGTTERSSLNFTRWVWKFKESAVLPRAYKLAETLAYTAAYFSKAFQFPELSVLQLAKWIVGRLVEICMGCHPLLFTQLQTFSAL